MAKQSRDASGAMLATAAALIPAFPQFHFKRIQFHKIQQFYRNFVSYRWVDQRLVLRIRTAITDGALDEIRENFKDIIGANHFEQTVALPEESNEPELAGLPRLVFVPVKKNFGRLRMFIDAVNAASTSVPHSS